MSVVNTILNATVFLPFNVLVKVLDTRNEVKHAVTRAKYTSKAQYYAQQPVGNMETAEMVYKSHFRFCRTTAEVIVTNVHTGEIVWNGLNRVIVALFGKIPLEKLADELLHKYHFAAIHIIRAELSALPPMAEQGPEGPSIRSWKINQEVDPAFVAWVDENWDGER